MTQTESTSIVTKGYSIFVSKREYLVHVAARLFNKLKKKKRTIVPSYRINGYYMCTLTSGWWFGESNNSACWW